MYQMIKNYYTDYGYNNCRIIIFSWEGLPSLGKCSFSLFANICLRMCNSL